MWFSKNKNKKASIPQSPLTSPAEEPKQKVVIKLKTSLQQNIKTIQEALGKSSDIVTREIRIGKQGNIKAGILYTDGLTDTASLQNFILETLMLDLNKIDLQEKASPEQNLISVLKDVALTVGEIKEITSLEVIITSLLSGDTILLIDGYSQVLVISNKKWAERAVSEPTAQTVVRGPQEGFNENLRVNTALIRRRIKDPNLRIESKEIGMRTKTNIAIVYIQDIANEKIVEEVRLRLDRIDIDGVLGGGNLEGLIQDSTYSPFPTIFNSERPDVVASELLEGRIAIVVDGTPFVLVVPALFVQFFQSPEDYNQRTIIGSLVRFLRFIAFGISLLAPAVYIAITTFHQAMLPPALLISLAAQREGVPFPAFIEVLIMEVTFEILREAGIRMPRSIGSAMSIVGAFVIGTAAVEAGLVSAMMVIVVSITAITSFVPASYEIAISVRIIRFVFIALAATFGIFGIVIGLIGLVLHLCSLRSFGVPYMSPLAPFNISDQKDTFIVLPIWKMTTRPHLIGKKNMVKQQDSASAKPAPPKK
ncbi:spore germination protein [Solibacillus cecembensis]|uniref:spore germination protein n=1 Tax=Solibacillus cecembensis TaxID=459347 RepID=UPI003D03A84C